ncbi:MAG TPA: hypothetical protein VI603_12065 [Saprospiraceae bacterium]|nr:hypothetical protein [Saprospiraceae bacterium]
MKTQLLFIPMAMLLYACDKTEVIILEKECVEDQRLINCEDLKNAVLKKVEQWTDYEINKLCFDLLPYPTAEDDIGHEENLNELVKRLNTECGNIITTLQCYACIETGPGNISCQYGT